MTHAPAEADVVAFVAGYVALSKGKRFAAKRALWDAAESSVRAQLAYLRRT